MKSILKNSIEDIIHKYDSFFFNKSNVVGLGLGYKYVKNLSTKEPCLHVFVENKLSEKNMHKNHVIPKVFLGVKTDVLETGLNLYASNDPSTSFLNNSDENRRLIKKLRSRVRPIEAGLNIGPYYKRISGTLGCIVFDKKTDYPYILSNNHILSDLGSIKVGTPIIQPSVSVAKGAYKNNIIAKLTKSIDLKPSLKKNPIYNLGDAAIAELAPNVDFNLSSSNNFDIQGTQLPILNLPVKKIGAKSGITHGSIISISVKTSIKAGIDKDDTKLKLFYENQILTTPMSRPGDSGAILLDSSNKAIGLILGGSKKHDVVTPIKTILDFFSVYVS